MNAYEKYYRRSYNAITRLIDSYKKGYQEDKMFDFRKNLLTSGINPSILFEEQADIMFTIAVALLGLNKESIEHTEKFTEYKKSEGMVNIRENITNPTTKKIIDLFDSKKVINTDLDNWLSIIKNIPSDISNLDHIKRVRNGLLHSNFYVEGDNPYSQIVHIKTKSYYESELLSSQFQHYVFEYFSNIDKLSITEKMCFYLMDTENQIKSREDLVVGLLKMCVVEYTYNNLKSVVKNTPETIFVKSVDERYKLNYKEIIKKMNRTKNFENFKETTRNLSPAEISYLFVYIEKNYGDEFYKMDVDTQCGIITTQLQYRLLPKKEISNWLMHFWYLYSTLFNGSFHKEFFRGDEFSNDSCFSSLMILKAYLIMYRMQASDFDEIDYSKVDFDRSDPKTNLVSLHTKMEITTEDYFQESFDKEKAKGVHLSDDDIWNKVISEVIRNSLAHGNVRPYQDNSLANMIEFTDVDPKNGSVRKIQMPLEKFEVFLNSMAFSPSYCYKKEEEAVIRTRTK